jgi:hypothetical protein
MREEIRDRLAMRTVCVRTPSGESEYWLTDQDFAAGDMLRRNGHVWVVADVLQPGSGRSHLTVRLRQADAHSPSTGAATTP